MKNNEVCRISAVTFLLFVFGCDYPENMAIYNKHKQMELFQMLDTAPNGPYWCCNEKGLVDVMILDGTDVNQENIRVVSTIENLRKLILRCCVYSDEPLSVDDFKRLKSLKNLQHLVLYGAVEKLSEEMCQAISELSQLEELTIDYSIIDIKGQKLLENIKSLHLIIDSGEYPML